MKNIIQEREELELLLNKEFLTEEELDALERNPFLITSEYSGTDEIHTDHYKYKMTVLQPGYLPTDENTYTDCHIVYVKKEVERF